MPTYHGENVVLRLLSDKAQAFTLETLGFTKQNQNKILSALKRPYGMILATGPTGSGKTTTLYTLIKMLNRPETSIVTIEDPVEYAVDNIEQIQVNPRTGLTFAQGLRSILRQDPNVIMVGEIRDSETAGIATNVALTGHLLLSTLHTNDPATTLPRLLDMGIESYLVASTVNIAIGQRLLRRICKKCKKEKKFTSAELKSLNESIPEGIIMQYKTFYEGTGCSECNNTGYMGRVPIHEVLEVDSDIRTAVLKKASASQIKEIAIDNGMVPMGQDGLRKAAEGLTTVSEVLRISHE
jgi:type II secretory ATPase GspE/PulE/Tfp pilus assembly ATPase PilB-like protein